VAVHIICDFIHVLIHVLEYLWRAAWCFFDEGDTAAEAWVAEHARPILAGKPGITAAAIRRKATRHHPRVRHNSGALEVAGSCIRRSRGRGLGSWLDLPRDTICSSGLCWLGM
jgi:hypothetical protein